MSVKDPHDPRRFRHFAKLAADGTVVAIVEVADVSIDGHALAPADSDASVHVEITQLRPYDFTGVKITMPTGRDKTTIVSALSAANKVKRGG